MWSEKHCTPHVFIALSKSLCSNNCISKTLAYVFPSWNCINNHLKVLDLQILHHWRSTHLLMMTNSLSSLKFFHMPTSLFSIWLHFWITYNGTAINKYVKLYSFVYLRLYLHNAMTHCDLIVFLRCCCFYTRKTTPKKVYVQTISHDHKFFSFTKYLFIFKSW